jgi:soluble lytic murein transglycosylase-like protein
VGILVTGLIATIAYAKTPHPNKTTSTKCSITFQESAPFVLKIWDEDKWRRGKPRRAVLTAYKHRLACSPSSDHRKALKRLWRREKDNYYEHRKYKRRWGSCTHAGPVRDCIHGAALTYNADESWMLTVSYCESTWDRFAQNPSGSTGLFQFLPSTWYGTPYGDKDIYSVKWQSLAAAWMYVQGRSGEWVCSG